MMVTRATWSLMMVTCSRESAGSVVASAVAGKKEAAQAATSRVAEEAASRRERRMKAKPAKRPRAANQGEPDMGEPPGATVEQAT